MANIGGSTSIWRRVLLRSMQSVLLYGEKVWADTPDKEVYRKRLAKLERRGALRVVSAYRMVSEPAVGVIAGVIAVALLVNERQAIYKRKGEEPREVILYEERNAK